MCADIDRSRWFGEDEEEEFNDETCDIFEDVGDAGEGELTCFVVCLREVILMRGTQQ